MEAVRDMVMGLAGGWLVGLLMMVAYPLKEEDALGLWLFCGFVGAIVGLAAPLTTIPPTPPTKPT